MKRVNGKKIILSAVTAIALTVGITGCGSDSNDPTVGRAALNASTTSQAKIDAVADNVIRATYVTLETNSAALKTALTGFDSNVTAANVTVAREAWRAVRAPWESSEAYIVSTTPSVGNATDGNTDSWPVSSVGDIQAGLTAWDGDSLTIQSADGEIKGFHTIEYYLFGDGTAVETSTSAATRLNASSNAQGKYLKALGSAFEHDMSGLTTIWTVQDDAATAGEDETGSGIATFKGLNKADAAANLIQGCVDIATEVGDGKIDAPLGDGTIDTTKVESQFSWNSSADFYNNIYSIKKVWEGGLMNLATIAGVPATKTEAVTAAITEALSKIALISDLNTANVIAGTEEISSTNSFRNKLTTGNASIVLAQTKVKALTETLEAVQIDMNK